MIRRLTSNICHHTSHIRRLTSIIRPLISYLCHQTSVVRHLPSDIRRLTSDVRYERSVIRRLLSDCLVSDVCCLMADIWCLSDVRHLMVPKHMGCDVWCVTCVWCLMSDVWYMFDLWSLHNICMMLDFRCAIWCLLADVLCKAADVWCMSEVRLLMYVWCQMLWYVWCPWGISCEKSDVWFITSDV